MQVHVGTICGPKGGGPVQVVLWHPNIVQPRILCGYTLYDVLSPEFATGIWPMSHSIWHNLAMCLWVGVGHEPSPKNSFVPTKAWKSLHEASGTCNMPVAQNGLGKLRKG